MANNINYSEIEEIDLSDYFWFLARNHLTILGVALMVTLISLLIVDLTPPKYEAQSKIWVQEEQQQGISSITDMMMLPMLPSKNLETFRAIIMTRTILAKSIRELRNENLLNPMPIYRGKLLSSIAKLFRFDLSGKTEQNKMTIEEWENEQIDFLLKGGLRVEIIRDTAVIELGVKARTPERARILADRIALVFQKFIRSDRQRRMKATEKFAEANLSEVKLRLEQAEEEVKEFQIENQTIDLPSEAEMIIENIGQIDLGSATLLREVAGAKAKLESLTSELSRISRKVVSAETFTENPNVLRLEQALQEYEIELVEQRARYPQLDHPDIKRLNRRLQETEAKIALEDRKRVSSQTSTLNPIHQSLTQQIIGVIAEIRSGERRLQSMDRDAKNYENMMATWPRKQLELARLKRKVLLNQNLYSALEEAKQEAGIASAAELGSVTILEEANLPYFPVTPKVRVNLLVGAFLGVMLGLGVAIFREIIDGTYKTIEEAQKHLESFGHVSNFLGAIPQLGDKNGEEIDPVPIAISKPRSASAEAFRVLRTKMQFIDPDNPLRTILVTSSIPSEGKSTIASNLAVTLARLNKKVLLVDADMRRPILHKKFPDARLNGTNRSDESSGNEESDLRSPGLSEFLMGVRSENGLKFLRSMVRGTSVETLHLMTSGTIPPNPAELLSSDMMKKALELMLEEYDYVLFDSPPVRAVADPTILATIVDNIIFVFDVSTTKKLEIAEGIESLSNVAKGRTGVLCNLRKGRGYGKKGDYYYGGDSYYHSYYEENE